jgi:hypothetical protein
MLITATIFPLKLNGPEASTLISLHSTESGKRGRDREKVGKRK